MTKKKTMKNRFFRWIVLWGILPLAVLYAILLLWHPQNKMMDSFFKQLRDQTGIGVTYREITVTPSFRIRMKDVVVEQAESRQFTVDGQSVTVKPQRYFSASYIDIGVAWSELFKAHIALALKGNAYGGSFRGTVRFPVRDIEHSPLHVKLSWEEIRLNELKKEFPQLTVTQGVSRGTADLILPPGGTGADGPVDLVIENAGFKLPEQVAGALDIQLIDRIEGRIILKNHVFTFEKLWAKSPSGAIRIDGNIYPATPSKNTRLDLTVRYYPLARGEQFDESKYIPVTIRGTAGKPDVSFMGMQLSF